MTRTWTDERDAMLRDAWATSSASEIAAEMGGFEHCKDGGRSSVSGRASRLGLTKVSKTFKRLDPDEKRRRLMERRVIDNDQRRIARAAARGDECKTRPRRAAPVDVVAPPFEPIGIPFADLNDFRPLAANQCRKIEGDDFPYITCASVMLPGKSYCEHHHEICYQKPTQPAAVTPELREKRREQGQAQGFANIRNGRCNGPAFTSRMIPVVNAEAVI